MSLKSDLYLHSMGIQAWSVRPPIEKRKSLMASSSQVANTPSIKKVADVKKQLPVAPTKTTTTPTPPLLQTAVVSDVVRFNLIFFVFADLLIISELPLHDQRCITPEQERLLRSIRLSLGYTSSEPLQSVKMIWPLIESGKIDQGEAAAKEAVNAQVKKQMDLYRPKYVVLMGNAACRYVLGSDMSFDGLRGQLIVNEQMCAVVTYGINELLRVPTLKSAAWQDLQVVRPLSK